MEKFVITLARSCGSGGTLVGKKLAEKLSVEYYDSKILRMASDDSGISEELFARADEKLRRTPLFKVSRKVYGGELIPPESADFTSSENLFNYQAKVIRELAATSSCVVVGRCAEFVLRDRADLFRVFISGSYDKCTMREVEEHGIGERAAREKVDRINKYRSEYHEYYTGKTWAHPGNYDLCLSTDYLTFEQCADIIISAMHMKLGEKSHEK